MSAFLGKIHYWLFNKIQLHEKLIENIINLAESKDYNSKILLNESYSRYGLPVTGLLENEIEHTNIHGWLQQRIVSVESRLAYIVTELLRNNNSWINGFLSGSGTGYKYTRTEDGINTIRKV